MNKKIQKAVIGILIAVLLLIVSMRAFGSDLVAMVIFTMIIYSALIVAIVNSSKARRAKR